MMGWLTSARTDESTESTPSRTGRVAKKVGAVMIVTGMISAAGVAGATWGGFRERGGGWSDAKLFCGGGMSNLGHVFSEDVSVFPGDPQPVIEIVADIDPEGYVVEEITTGVHTGTHLDAPLHFIGDEVRSIDEYAAEEFVWPAYVIDVRDRMATEGPDFQLSVRDIRAVERSQGRIPDGAMVIIQTGFDAYFGTPAYEDDFPGFSGDAVQWMFDERGIDGVGSDTFGPDAWSDETYGATYTALANDGLALPGLANVDSLHANGDLIIAPPVRLENGSAFMVNPIACHRTDRWND